MSEVQENNLSQPIENAPISEVAETQNEGSGLEQKSQENGSHNDQDQTQSDVKNESEGHEAQIEFVAGSPKVNFTITVLEWRESAEVQFFTDF